MITVIPHKTGLWQNKKQDMSVLVRISPPSKVGKGHKPDLNLAFVVDRSGSMVAALPLARQAVSQAINAMSPTDVAAVITYDDRVSTVVPATALADKSIIHTLVAAIASGGTTNLFGGWDQGRGEVAKHQAPKRINRVLLLTDGLVNAGITDQEQIISAVKTAQAAGIQTTAIGLGVEYNEVLLEAMARNGDGSYYYIKDKAELAAVFDQELQGVVQIMGRKVTLKVTSSAGVKVTEVFNDLTLQADGSIELPNLRHGNSVDIAVQLHIPPQTSGTDLAEFHLTWEDEDGKPQTMSSKLSLPLTTVEEFEALPESEIVKERTAVYQASKFAKSAAAAADKGDFLAAQGFIEQGTTVLRAFHSSTDGLTHQTMSGFHSLTASLKAGDMKHMTKSARAVSYRTSVSRVDPKA